MYNIIFDVNILSQHSLYNICLRKYDIPVCYSQYEKNCRNEVYQYVIHCMTKICRNISVCYSQYEKDACRSRYPFFLVFWYIFRGSNCVIVVFASIVNEGQFLQKRICSPWSKFFPLRTDSISERFPCTEKLTKSRKKNSIYYIDICIPDLVVHKFISEYKVYFNM